MSVNQLAQRMVVHRTTAIKLLNALADRSLVRGEGNMAAQRIVRLQASAEGKRLLLKGTGAAGRAVGRCGEAARY
jgi:DNA-binding MarR family transcriptional regulator